MNPHLTETQVLGPPGGKPDPTRRFETMRVSWNHHLGEHASSSRQIRCKGGEDQSETRGDLR